MNDKIIEILKYFFITLLSVGIMYFFAVGKVNLPVILALAACFTVLFILDYFKVFEKLSITEKTSKEDKFIQK